MLYFKQIMKNNSPRPAINAAGADKAGGRVNWPLIGNHHIKSFLIESFFRDNMAGTYIFHGPDNLGKTTAAVFFAKILLCEQNRQDSGILPCGQCPSCRQFRLLTAKDREPEDDGESDSGQETISSHGDFHLVKKEKDKKNISIEQVREIIKILGMSSFLNSYKIGIIKHAETLSEAAANALLKTLEEPKDKVVVILILSDLEKLPLTIQSRAQLLEFKPVRFEDIYEYLIGDKKIPRSQARNISRLSLGRPALAMKFLENRDFFDTYVSRMQVFLDFFGHDINERIKAIDAILPRGLSGLEQAAIARRLLEIWQGVVRDMALVGLGNRDLTQHELAEDRIAALSGKYPPAKLFGLFDRIEQAGAYLDANVSPKLVLENVAMNI